MHAWRYARFSIGEEPNPASSSCLSFAKERGVAISSFIVRVIVAVVVSMPAVNNSYFHGMHAFVISAMDEGEKCNLIKLKFPGTFFSPQ